MHLDTVFTMVDRDKFTVHVPNILSDITVFVMELDDDRQMHIQQENGRLEDILKEHLGLSQVTLIPCGQGHTIDAAREQWSDGTNTAGHRPRRGGGLLPELCHQPLPGRGRHPHPRHSQRRAEPGAGRSPVHEYAADPGRSVDRRRFAAGSAALPRRMHYFSFEISNAPDWCEDVRRCRTGLNPHFLFVLPKKMVPPAELYRFGTEKPGGYSLLKENVPPPPKEKRGDFDFPPHPP